MPYVGTIMTDLDKPKGERIAKMLARAGVGSRRAVERMIEAGMVKINGKRESRYNNRI